MKETTEFKEDAMKAIKDNDIRNPRTEEKGLQGPVLERSTPEKKREPEEQGLPSVKIKEYVKKQGGGRSSSAPDRRFYLHGASNVSKDNGTEGPSDRNGGLYCHHAASRHSLVGESMSGKGMRTKERAVRNKETEHNTISAEGLGLEKESANAALRDQEPVKKQHSIDNLQSIKEIFSLYVTQSEDKFSEIKDLLLTVIKAQDNLAERLEQVESESAKKNLNPEFRKPSAPYRNIGTVQLGIANKDKEEGTMLSMKNHEDFKDSDEETLKKEDESCNGSRDENYDVKLRAKQPCTVFENEMKSVKQKDENPVDPIEEVADTTTKPVKYEEQADWIDPKVENMMRNKIKDYDQHQKMKKIMKRLTTLEDQKQNQRTLNKKIKKQFRTMKKNHEPIRKRTLTNADRQHIDLWIQTKKENQSSLLKRHLSNKRKPREEVRTDARKSMNPVIRKRFSHTDYERELMEHHDYESARSSSWDKMSYGSDNTQPINGRFHFDSDSSDDSFDVRQQ